MSEEEHLSEPELVILGRPQISVEKRRDGMIEISTAGVSGDFRNVEIESVQIPPDCAREIAEALLALAE